VKIVNDFYRSSDGGTVLLDLSAACDTIDHESLLSILKLTWVSWARSCHDFGRTFLVVFRLSHVTVSYPLLALQLVLLLRDRSWDLYYFALILNLLRSLSSATKLPHLCIQYTNQLAFWFNLSSCCCSPNWTTIFQIFAIGWLWTCWNSTTRKLSSSSWAILNA